MAPLGALLGAGNFDSFGFENLERLRRSLLDIGIERYQRHIVDQRDLRDDCVGAANAGLYRKIGGADRRFLGHVHPNQIRMAPEILVGLVGKFLVLGTTPQRRRHFRQNQDWPHAGKIAG